VPGTGKPAQVKDAWGDTIVSAGIQAALYAGGDLAAQNGRNEDV